MTKCTIIIPTYNRPAYLRRILDYYDSFGEGLSIIVADSSSDENKKLNRDIVSSVSNLSIQYLDNYSTEINPQHKFADVVNYAKTKYCVFCADDDFVTLNGIRESVDFLEKNPDFAIAYGRYIGFHLEDEGDGKRRFRWAPAYSHDSILFPDAKTRLSHHLSDYSRSTFYAVHRTDFSKMIWEESAKFTDDMRFGELLPSMLTLIYGKVKCLDVLYDAREVIPDSLGSRARNLRDYIMDGTYEEKYKRFRECLSTHLSKQSQLDIKESGKLVDEAMAAYLKKDYYPPKSKMRVGYITTKVGHIMAKLNLPKWLIKRIRGSYARMVGSPIKRDFMEMSPSSKYYEDLNRIRRHVLYYSK